MVDAGVLDADKAESHPHANVLTRAIGAGGGRPELDKIVGVAQAGDRFLLCSDGLFKALDTGTIAALIAGADPASALIAAALAASARDNITAVVVETAAAEADVHNDTLLIRPN
jgi:serine/threonine-protein phosphatase Stp1